MAKGSFRLDLKRDDARTLMLKMDARMTYAGRERNAAYRADGERELKHIDSSRQLITADFNRARRDIQRRLEYLQTLQEHNRERRLNRTIAWCEEEEKDWERQAAAARRRRTLPKIKIFKNHKAEAVGSIRRDQKREFANKITHEIILNRSLNSLSESIAKRKAIAQHNDATLRTSDNFGIDGQRSNAEETLPSIKPTKNHGEHSISRAKPMSVQTTSLPGLGLPVSKVEKHTSSLSQIISSGEICKLPGIGAENDAQARKLGLARTFYMNTSGKSTGTNPQEVTNTSNRITTRLSVVDISADSAGASGLRTTSRGRFKIVDPATRTKKRWSPNETLGVRRQVPVRFYELKENPFMKEEVVPETSRSNDLFHADKADEMYVWLGFESEEEFEKLRRGELILEYDEDDVSDTNSNADQVLSTEHRREHSWLENTGPTGSPSELPRRIESKLSAPKILIASAGGDTSATKSVERFASASKMVMIVRQFQTNATDSP